MIEKVNEPGLFAAIAMTLVGTIGHFLTQDRSAGRFDYVWLACFALALFTLSGAVVNFDPKRLIK